MQSYGMFYFLKVLMIHFCFRRLLSVTSMQILRCGIIFSRAFYTPGLKKSTSVFSSFLRFILLFLSNDCIVKWLKNVPRTPSKVMTSISSCSAGNQSFSVSIYCRNFLHGSLAASRREISGAIKLLRSIFG